MTAARLRFRLSLACIAAALPAAAQSPPSLHALAQAFRCELVDRLERIHAGDRSTSRNRFIAVWPRGRPDDYVQCIFFEQDTKMLCETPRSTLAGHEAERRRLGFQPVPTGPNDAQELDLGTSADLGRIADLILATLHDANGLRLPAALEIRAPKAPARGPVPLRCMGPES